MQALTKKTVGRMIGFVAVVLVPVVVIGRWSSRSPEVDVAAYERGAVVQTAIDDIVRGLERDLELTGEQRAHVDELLEKWHARLDELTAGVDAQRNAFVEALRRESPDADRLHVLIDAQVDALRPAGHDLTDDVVAFARTLTAEQRAVIRAYWEQHSRGTHGRWGGGRRR